MPLGVRFCHHGQQLPRPGLCHGKSITHDPRHPDTGENRNFCADFFWHAAMRPAAASGIFTFGILTDDHPVEIPRPDIAERCGNPRNNPCRPDIGVLIKPLTDRQPQPPESNMIRHIRRTDSTEIDRIKRFKRLKPVFGHHHAVLFVIIRPPVEIFDAEAEITTTARQSGKHLKPG